MCAIPGAPWEGPKKKKTNHHDRNQNKLGIRKRETMKRGGENCVKLTHEMRNRPRHCRKESEEKVKLVIKGTGVGQYWLANQFGHRRQRVKKKKPKSTTCPAESVRIVLGPDANNFNVGSASQG